MALSQFEAERNARIQRNKERMQDLNLPMLFDAFNASVRRKHPQQHRAPPTKHLRSNIQEKRRSTRLANLEPADYNEAALEKADALCERGTNTYSGPEEVYTEEHVKALGDCKEPWELFVDGYDGLGQRVYSKEAGLTCHQCRQKTLGLRTICSGCNSLKGVFCGDCLFMRYGENIKEVNANPQWTCPSCRDVCNCSIHRIRRGWAPTGSLYRQAIAKGFKSVAHYIVLSKLAKPQEKPAEPEFECITSQAMAAESETVLTEQASEDVTMAADPHKEELRARRTRAQQKQITDILGTKKLQSNASAVDKKAVSKVSKKRTENSAPFQAHGLARMTRSRARA